MTQNHGKTAFGAPGIPPRWTVSAKNAVGTAYSASSRLWLTVSLGIVSEVYFPTIDRPQTRDLGFLITDGETFLHEEKRDLKHEFDLIAPGALGFRVTSSDSEGRYRIVKEIIADPHRSVLLVHAKVEGCEDFLERLRLYVLWAPHLDVGGSGNNGEVMELAGGPILTAHRNGIWSTLAATVPFRKCSCGYVGASDGWTDLTANFKMDWEFARAPDGNIALTGEIDLHRTREITLGLAFGHNLHSSETKLMQSLDVPFDEHRKRFLKQWKRVCAGLTPIESATGDGGSLYRLSYSLLLGHEDKTYQGAMIASLSIPWGQTKGDADIGGYHLVWPRDMYNSATGLMAAGNNETARKGLIYLACAQREDGGFHQNFWITGEPYWTGIQLDAVAFPILLAWRLHQEGALGNFDPYPMVFKAASYLMRHGPATPQERWEENSGLSPSTLASNIAALTCAAWYAREKRDAVASELMQAYADFLECHLEAWTVTAKGTLLDGVRRHYVRINPVDPDDPHADESLDGKTVLIRNLEPGARQEYPANEVVDAGFLELVRHGVRKAGTKLMKDSLRVVDAVLKTDTPAGPVWKRYNHDGYGQRTDGGPFEGWGEGRGWPLLTGERGHYELAAGHEAAPYIRAMEGFQNSVGLLPEQVWDGEDLPEAHMFKGGPTGSAMPLAWAHAEYVKLVRSAHDGAVYDSIPVVVERYAGGGALQPVEFWTFRRQVARVGSSALVFVMAHTHFELRWTVNEWADMNNSEAVGMGSDTWFVELPTTKTAVKTYRFTFYWPESERWEGRDFSIEVMHADS